MSVEPEVVEQTPEEISSSLNAGFNKVRGTPTENLHPEIEIEAPVVTPEEASPDAPATPDAPAEEPAEELIAGLGLTPTEVRQRLAAIDEIKNDSAVRERKLLGQMGSLKSELMQAINESKSTTKTVDITLKNLREGGYEDLAEILAKDLSAISAAPAETVDVEAINQQINERVTAAIATQRKEDGIRQLTRAVPDWAQLKDTPDFKLYRSLQPADEQKKMTNTIDAEYLIDTFAGFNKWKDRSTKPDNAKRLEANLTPRGSGTPSPSVLPDKAGLAIGFNKVRGLNKL